MLHGDASYETSPELKSRRLSIKLSGKPKTLEHRKNLSKSRLGQPSSRKGVKLSQETKAKISASKAGQPSPRKGVKLSQETKAKISASRTGKRASQQTIDSLKKSHSTPEYLELARKRGLEVSSRPNQTKKISDKLKKYYSSEEKKEIQRQRRLLQPAVTESRNEKLVQKFLDSKKIHYEKHKTIKLPYPKKYHQPDLLVHDKKIIEIYGDYFHANPRKYEKDSFITIRRKRTRVDSIWENDRSINESLLQLGYKILILWENEFGNRRKPKLTKDLEDKIMIFLDSSTID